VLTLLQLAATEHWADAPLLRTLTELSFRDPESALNQLIDSIGVLRQRLVPQYRASFVRSVGLSRSHEWLAKLPLAAAITTNYDGLLEQLGQPWEFDVITLQSGRTLETCTPETSDHETSKSETRPNETTLAPFLFKLYGDLEENDTLLFSQAEFHAALAQSASSEILRHALEKNTLLFVGCSLEGLLADLNELGPPPELRRTHFAVAGVSSAAWERQAAELTQRFGIEVLVCSADQIHAALPKFLEKLSWHVNQVRGVYRSETPDRRAARRAS